MSSWTDFHQPFRLYFFLQTLAIEQGILLLENFETEHAKNTIGKIIWVVKVEVSDIMDKVLVVDCSWFHKGVCVLNEWECSMFYMLLKWDIDRLKNRKHIRTVKLNKRLLESAGRNTQWDHPKSLTQSSPEILSSKHRTRKAASPSHPVPVYKADRHGVTLSLVELNFDTDTLSDVPHTVCIGLVHATHK